MDCGYCCKGLKGLVGWLAKILKATSTVKDLVGALSMIVKTDGSFTALITLIVVAMIARTHNHSALD